MQSMTFVEKLKWAIFPAIVVIGIGILEINFPRAMHGFHDYYAGRKAVGLILLLFEMIIWLTWSKLGGIVAIFLGITAIVICLLPSNKYTEATDSKEVETEDKKRIGDTSASFTFRTRKNHIQQKLQNRQS